MNTFKLKELILASLVTLSLSSCQAIADIFKAGMWVGVIGVAIIILLIIWVISKVTKK